MKNTGAPLNPVVTALKALTAAGACFIAAQAAPHIYEAAKSISITPEHAVSALLSFGMR